MNAVFAGLTGINLQIFLDDICIASKTWPEHLKLLDQVFTVLAEDRLKLKPSKCSFGCSLVGFLGHRIDATGIRADPAKLKAIEAMLPPTTKEDIMRVHGLFNYYRRLIPRFAILAEPFTRLLRKNEEFEWSKEQDDA